MNTHVYKYILTCIHIHTYMYVNVHAYTYTHNNIVEGSSRHDFFWVLQEADGDKSGSICFSEFVRYCRTREHLFGKVCAMCCSVSQCVAVHKICSHRLFRKGISLGKGACRAG